MSESGYDESPQGRERVGRASTGENSLRPARRPAKRPKPTVTTEPVPRPTERKARNKLPEPAAVPEDVRKRFVQIKNAYFFADGARAFTDRGDRLTTPSENTVVVQSLVAIAQARGWGQVVVRGSDRFRREAWAAARTAGLEVRGYKPTEFERSRLIRSIAGRSVDGDLKQSASDPQGAAEQSGRSARAARGERGTAPGALVVGTLVEHGRAPYQHDTKAPLSYYVKIETPQGDRTIWGVDLERAFKESLTQPAAGDAVGLRSIRQEQVTVKAPSRDTDGKIVGEAELATHRNRWIVEKQEFFEQRARAAQTLRDASIEPKRGGREHPELLGSYLQVHAAEIAAKRLRDPQDQRRFVEKVREALAASVASGEPLPPVRLREQRTPEPRSRPPRSPEPALTRA